MKISVIVPAFNEEQGIAASLRSIRQAMTAFDDVRWSSELIVCDNNSTDGTAALARAEGARVVFEPINQISRARNTGAARATADWLMFVDADSHPSRELFVDVVGAIQEGRCIAGGSTVRFDKPESSCRYPPWVALEHHQPSHAVGRGVVHLLRGGGISRGRRFQPGPVRRRGNRSVSPRKAPGPPKETDRRDPAPPSDPDERAESAPLHVARGAGIHCQDDCPTGPDVEERGGVLLVVRRPALTG